MRILERIAIAFVLATVPSLAQNIGDGARQQIADILAAKKQLTGVERKVDTNLLLAAKHGRGELQNASFAHAIHQPTSDARGLIAIDIRCNVTPGLLQQIANLGGRVESQAPAHQSIRASVPLAAVERLAAQADVQAIAPASHAIFNVGSVTSQGYITHRANEAAKAGYTGAGVKVGVMSDTCLAADQANLAASGDLPANVIIIGTQPLTGTDEGCAMMEIVHDIAPGAQLYFASAAQGIATSTSNLAALASAGCTIIVDDVTYPDESVFQDGPLAQAVNTFVAGGGLYFSSAGNFGNLSSGTSATWEGDFLNGGAVSGPIATGGETGSFHNFGTSANPVLQNEVTATNGLLVTLQWSDPWGGSGNDYDIFLLDDTGTTVRAFSVGLQSGNQDPFEEFEAPDTSGILVVVLYSGSPRALHLSALGGLGTNARLAIATAGSTFGHNGGANTISIGAVAWDVARVGTQPFQGGAADPIEPFSSDGPRKMFYSPNGSPITPGNLLFATSGGLTLQKPDFAAADHTVANTPGFLPFFGTSAAAPHAAAIAALLKSAKPAATAAQIKAALAATALDIMAPGADRDSGSGIVMAMPAITYLLSH